MFSLGSIADFINHRDSHIEQNLFDKGNEKDSRIWQVECVAICIKYKYSKQPHYLIKYRNVQIARIFCKLQFVFVIDWRLETPNIFMVITSVRRFTSLPKKELLSQIKKMENLSFVFLSNCVSAIEPLKRISKALFLTPTPPKWAQHWQFNLIEGEISRKKSQLETSRLSKLESVKRTSWAHSTECYKRQKAPRHVPKSD